LGLASFVGDIAIGYSIQSRIKAAIDMASLAGISQIVSTSDVTDAKNEALTYLNSNLSNNIPNYSPITLSDSNLTIQVGVYDYTTMVFTWDELSPDINSIMISYTYPIMTVFASVFMVDSIQTSGTSIAAKRDAGYMAPGTGFPLAIDVSALEDAIANGNMLSLYQSGADTNSYLTAFDDNADANDIRDLVEYFQYGTGTPSVELYVGDEFAINNGSISSVYMDLDLSALTGKTFMFPIVSLETDMFSQMITAEGFIGANVTEFFDLDGMGDNYVTIEIIPGYIDNNYGGSKVGISTISSGGADLLAQSFTLVD
jgi:hypothetical protein